MRTLSILVAGALLALTAACGGSGAPDPTATPEPTEIRATATSTTVPVPTPTPLPATADALRVASRNGIFIPTVAEFGRMPQTEIELPGGEVVSGVSIADLAAEVDAAEAAIVTVEGKQIGVDRAGFMRRPLDEVGAGVVIYITAAGQLMLASTLLPELEWLTAIRSVTFE